MLISRFASVFVVAAKDASIRLASTPFRDFLADESYRLIDCPHTFAAHALNVFCIDDNKFNGFTVGIIAVFRFLESVTTGDAESKEASTELRAILFDDPKIDILTNWAKKHFPIAT